MPFLRQNEFFTERRRLFSSRAGKRPSSSRTISPCVRGSDVQLEWLPGRGYEDDTVWVVEWNKWIKSKIHFNPLDYFITVFGKQTKKELHSYFVNGFSLIYICKTLLKVKMLFKYRTSWGKYHLVRPNVQYWFHIKQPPVGSTGSQLGKLGNVWEGLRGHLLSSHTYSPCLSWPSLITLAPCWTLAKLKSQ